MLLVLNSGFANIILRNAVDTPASLKIATSKSEILNVLFISICLSNLTNNRTAEYSPCDSGSVWLTTDFFRTIHILTVG